MDLRRVFSLFGFSSEKQEDFFLGSSLWEPDGFPMCKPHKSGLWPPGISHAILQSPSHNLLKFPFKHSYKFIATRSPFLNPLKTPMPAPWVLTPLAVYTRLFGHNHSLNVSLCSGGIPVREVFWALKIKRRGIEEDGRLGGSWGTSSHGHTEITTTSAQLTLKATQRLAEQTYR